MTIYHEALRMAEIRLHQACEQSRWDCAAQLCVSNAIDFLRRTGRADLADRLEDDPWGADVGAVLAEVTKARVT